MPQFCLRIISCFIIAFITHSPAIYADGRELPEVIITADPLGEFDSHLSQPVQVLTREELETRSVGNIGETIANELGVSASDFGPGVGRPIIRGLAGSRISVLENGISTMDVANISVDHAVPVEPIFARQLEIFRGPATLLFGSGASGGVVNLVNDRILRYVPESLEADLSLRYETVSDGITGAGSMNAGAGNVAVHVDGMVRDTHDYAIPGFAELDPDEPGQGTLENSSVQTRSLAGGLSYVGESGFIGFAVSRLTSDYGVPGEHHHDEGEGDEEATDDEEEEGGVRIDMQQTRYDLQATLNEPVTGLRKVQVRWAYNDYEHDEVEASGEIGTALDNDEIEGRIEFVHAAVGSWDGALGIHYRHKDFAAIGEESFVLPSELESIAVFVLEKSDFGRWHVDLGGRYEHQEVQTNTGLQAAHDLLSLSVGVNRDYARGYQFGLAITHAQRAPSIEELYSNGQHLATTTFEVGDPGLHKEKSTNIDIYWRKIAGRLTFTANLFYNQIDDFIFLQEQDRNNDGVADRVHEDFDGEPANILPAEDDEELLLVSHTQDNADFYGFEIEGGIRVLEDDRTTLDARLWADYVQGQRSGNVDLPRITPWRFGAGLKYARGPWFASADYIRVNEQNNIAPLESSTAGYNMLSIDAGYTFKLAQSNVTLFASADNLLDEEIRRHTSFVKEIAPLPGRSGVFGMRASF